MSNPKTYPIKSKPQLRRGPSREQALQGEISDLRTRVKLLEGRLRERDELLQAISYDANVALSQTGHECPASLCLLNWSRERS